MEHGPRCIASAWPDALGGDLSRPLMPYSSRCSGIMPEHQKARGAKQTRSLWPYSGSALHQLLTTQPLQAQHPAMPA